MFLIIISIISVVCIIIAIVLLSALKVAGRNYPPETELTVEQQKSLMSEGMRILKANQGFKKSDNNF